MLNDLYGQHLSTTNPRTRDGINAFILGFLSNETRINTILEASQADPASGLAAAWAAALKMMTESHSGREAAIPFMEKALIQRSAALPREQRIIDTIEAWVEGDIPAMLRHGNHLLDEFPRELAMAKLMQIQYFNLGDTDGMARIAAKGIKASPDDPYMLGMLSFAQEQNHGIAAAEITARRALALRPKEPWSQHTLAHVYLARGKHEEGLAFLEEVRETWTDLNSFMDTHLWWHLCLFRLALGQHEGLTEIWDRQLWSRNREFSQDQIGAVSMLARMEIHGIDTGRRWQQVAFFLGARTNDMVNPFHTLQYLYGLARAGSLGADELMQNIELHSRNHQGFDRRRWRQVALPAARGMLCHARGDYAGAAAHLGPVLRRMSSLGGSHAQRELFDLIYEHSKDQLASGTRLRARLYSHPENSDAI